MYDNYNESTRRMISAFAMGMRVDTATITIPHTAHTAYYHIHVGKVLLTNLVGEIVVAADGAQTVHVDHVPTTGTASIVAAGADIDSWVIGDIITLNGLFSDVIFPVVAAGTSSSMAYKGIVLTPGVLNFGSSGTTAGDWKWSLFYVPLDDGAYVEAVV